ncbi:hypothetical protein GCM10009676_18640 [Prauserella halophila]|uniref:Glycosyltransferase 2-like domain-containing protein n=1 Tax=Prauserella halophila TaxID=185641 RepID=A0ABP4GXI5_9PSEU|nr:glycosyltransferase [Prauserella halophila]MCP2235934.1 Glycosyltransferase, GT2 family [Prauserella halophila]
MKVSASVIVAVHGNTNEVDGLLRCLATQDFLRDIEVVVVDNHRRPYVPPTLLAEAGLSGTVVHEPRTGLSRARNTGVGHARGEYVLFTDPDSRPEPGWVRGLVEALTTTGAYCAGGRVESLFTDLNERPDLDAGIEQFFVPDAWPERTCALRAPFWLLGCNLATRSSPPPVFDEQLGARPRRHLSCEDLELSIRVEHAGLAVIVVPDALVHRAIHSADLRLPRVLARAFWHGVSIARVRHRHPNAVIYDSAQVADVLGEFRREHWRTAATHLARIAGWRLEALRPTRSTPAAGEDEVVMSR